MATRTLLCVEPDAAVAEMIRAAVAPYRLAFHSLSGGDEAIEWARQNAPAVMVVSVEPKKSGFATCNKVKRSADLKDIPLILTSADETAATLDQHKNLKTHADAYLRKPFTEDALLDRLGALVDLGRRAHLTTDRDIPVSGADDEIIIESDVLEEATPGATPPPVAAGRPPSDFTTTLPGGAKLAEEADRAFAAIRIGDTGPVADLNFKTPGSIPDSAPWMEEPTGNASPSGFDDGSTVAVANPMGAIASMFPTLSDAERDGGPAPDAHQRETERFDEASVVTAFATRIKELEARNQHLQADLDEARARPQAQPFLKEKELLGLREVINRKEKDLLDLRDSFDAKDRQILDHKDRVREHERARRDLEEKMLEVERNLVAASERITALGQDKEKAVEREKAIKTRLDEAQHEIRKAHEEADAFKKRSAAVEDRARAEVERARRDQEARLGEADKAHKTEIALLAEEHASADRARENQHRAEIEALKEAGTAELEGANRRADADRVRQTQKFETETARLRAQHEQELAEAEGEHARRLQARTDEIAALQQKLVAREAGLEALQSELAERNTRIADLRDRVTEMEARVAELEDQVLRAYQKMRADEKIADKVKRALTMAVDLLEGSTGPQREAAAGETAPEAVAAPEETST